MPTTTRRPLDEGARARLRDAQRLESDAVSRVLAAAISREGARAKLDAVIAKHQVAIGAADNAMPERCEGRGTSRLPMHQQPANGERLMA